MGRPTLVGPEDTHASWVYVIDAARALVLAMQERPAGAVLNIVDGHPASPAQFLRYFAESQGFGAPGGLPLFAPRLSRAQNAILGLNSHADNAAAQQQIGWTPRFASYRQGIDDMLLSWRAHEAVIS
jgi:nucleoside-diphosphate-sugar epimerase